MAGSFQTLETLPLAEQLLFNRFGRGPSTLTPFNLIHRAFEYVVDNQPSAVAVQQNGNQLTYRELDAAANTLANRLISRGLKPQQRVCIVVERSLSMIVAMLAVLKCGCQYVPLDGQVTAESALRHIFEDTQAPFILCLEKFLGKVQLVLNHGSTIVVLDSPFDEPISAVRPAVQTTSRDGAYIIYTSGSTGVPKGVDVAHVSVTNLLCNDPGKLGIRQGTNVAQLLSISFDMGQWEIFGTLMNGGTLLMRTSDWASVLKRAHTIISTPSILGSLKREEYPNIKVVAVAGEPCPKSLADEWAQQATFWNCCGPTEVTIVNTMQNHRSGAELSIGRPVPNTNVYILGEDENPVMSGQVGMMWVGGAAVSRGYLNLPQLTSARYKVDKFLSEGSLMFNTGDLCRWLPDGTIAHEGRADDQVKIKGFRVELDSVSSSIERTPGITKACAIYNDKVLWGFYTGPQSVPFDEVKSVVEKQQPYYAVPSKFIFLNSLPMTTNGKVDKRRLLESVTASVTEPEPVLQFEKMSEKAHGDFGTQVQVTTRAMTASSKSSDMPEKEYVLPGKKGVHKVRALRHRIFSLYRRFFSVVFIGNLVAMIMIWTSRSTGNGLQNVSTAVAANLLVAVLMRQEYVVNLLFNIACAVPTSAPMWIRRNCAKVYHIGGIHSGSAVASATWLIIFTVATSIRDPDPATLLVSYILITLMVSMAISAHPTLRQKFHDRFELIHRFAGWTALALFWVQTVVVTDHFRGSTPLGSALVRSPGLWLLSVATSSIILPWANLRKVEVRSEVLSEHAVRLYFKYTKAAVGTAIRLSERPLVEWHAFATIAKPNDDEFSVLVSNAGDWTSKQIKAAPTKIWVRGIPACGVLRITPLFKSVVLVATGSGIGPCLPVIYARQVPARIFWSTPHPEKNFGSEIISAVEAADPHAVIHNTKTMGRPDMVAITYRLLRESGAEAVCIISNKKLTQMVVYAMESRGIPAFGAIFDS
ncbi:amino acid adenylation domain-containing protein [Phlyctema vagabunda]|uniref:Amino acid adenylation domain-containing protein n=1 Tax=Phlyctema vagabunda TaxID=108571 RepID=A0ABR4PST1_9HELO